MNQFSTKIIIDHKNSSHSLDMNLPPSVSLDMLNISHAKKAQDLATETNYRTVLHEYTTLPTDISVAWAKKAYGLQSDVSLPAPHSATAHFKEDLLTTAACLLCRNSTGLT